MPGYRAAACIAAFIVSLPLAGAAQDVRIPIPPADPLDLSSGVTISDQRDSFLSAGPGDTGLSVFAVGMHCGDTQMFDGLRVLAVNANVLRVRAAARNGVRIFYDGPVQAGQVIHVPVKDFVWTGFTRDGDDDPTALRARAVCRTPLP